MQKDKSIIYLLVTLAVFFGGLAYSKIPNKVKVEIEGISVATASAQQKVVTPTVATSKQTNNIAGPCTKINVLMYHHIQDEKLAKSKKQTSLTVTPEFFRKHLQYLKDNNYEVIGPEKLISFFSGTEKLGPKVALITLDDGYEDNFLFAYPILKEFGFKAIVFTATGLINNPDYLSWDQVNQMKDLVYFGNHTWSHHGSNGNIEVLEKEIGMADKQLNEKGLNNLKIFAYPYGRPGLVAEEVLKSKGYALAFTTNHGNMLCKGNILELPRIRVGNSGLNSYGL